ncbi:hypothetical protein NEA10_17025 [Phormidium yuhuli AB48]|uniref:Uncharacterized protein n=1 Tax=Phormidium yuhuli AB48 TaxID=2940671 RepID=A0ABY5ANM9_9CYAN|nr:hypothetical protein [Phormidium yuhuli]USR90518.1 hypothetical protein NEA10_17025 [Phormidium yuhuli AB48]
MDNELLDALKDKIDGTKNSSLALFESPLQVVGYKQFTYTTVQSGITIPYVIIKWKSSKRVFYNCALINIRHLRTWNNFHEANRDVKRLIENIYLKPN